MHDLLALRAGFVSGLAGTAVGDKIPKSVCGDSS